MQIIDVYRYIREGGGMTVYPQKPEAVELNIMYRVVADDWKEISRDGVDWVDCADTDTANGWMERDAVTMIEEG